MRWGWWLLCLTFPLAAHPRVFNYKDASTAAYIRATGGYSALSQDPFANSSGAGTTISGTTQYNYGGEVGFMLGLSSNLHLRLGAEFLQENPVVADGLNSAGVSRFSLNSSVFIFNPNVTFEYVYSVHGNIRFFAELGAGYANVTVVNDYKMTPAGTTTFGVSDYKETMDTNTLSGIAGVGLETLFTDNVTLLADFGYRYLPVNNLKYKADVSTINNPSSVHKGDPVLNADGSKRNLNLGGLFGGVALRFYLNFF